MLAVLYELRDGILRHSSEGQRYINLFYRHAWELAHLLADPALRGQMRAMLVHFIPVFERRLAGEDAVFTAADVAAVEGLLDSIGQRGSRRLRADLQGFIRELRGGKVSEVLHIPVAR
jgi:hypothetical protein